MNFRINVKPVLFETPERLMIEISNLVISLIGFSEINDLGRPIAKFHISFFDKDKFAYEATCEMPAIIEIDGVKKAIISMLMGIDEKERYEIKCMFAKQYKYESLPLDEQ